MNRRQNLQQKPPPSPSANPRRILHKIANPTSYTPCPSAASCDHPIFANQQDRVHAHPMRPIQKKSQPNKLKENPAPLLSNHKMRKASKPRPPPTMVVDSDIGDDLKSQNAQTKNSTHTSFFCLPIPQQIRPRTWPRSPQKLSSCNGKAEMARLLAKTMAGGSPLSPSL